MKGFALLMPPTLQRDVAVWATVTDDSPLRIRLDGEADPLPFTPDSLVGQLVIGDRVWCAFATNGDPEFKGRRVVVIGLSGGTPPPVLTGLLPSAAAINGVLASTESISTTAAYQNMGSPSVISAFVKRETATGIKIDMHLTSQSSASATRGMAGVRINSTDYDVAPIYHTEVNSRKTASGTNIVAAGLAPGTYTVQGRWKRVSGTGTLQRFTTDDSLSLSALEVQT